jgi:hypothetical protein
MLRPRGFLDLLWVINLTEGEGFASHSLNCLISCPKNILGHGRGNS